MNHANHNLAPNPLAELEVPCLHGIPRLRLANLPTPIEGAPRFSAALGGPRFYLKRDDLTGLATGGNKTRKLEFLVADAIEQGADTLLTAGGPQSNHCRQTAAAAARLGLDCHLVFGGAKNDNVVGNRLLNYLFGAQEHWTPKGTRESKLSSLCDELRAEGKCPYVIPVGGSNSIGAMGYLAAMYELQAQMKQAEIDFDYIVFATSSGGTQAGLVVGHKVTKLSPKLMAISIDQTLSIDEQTGMTYQQFGLDIALGLNARLGLGLELSLADLSLNVDYLGGGYGVIGELEREAIGLLARTEGILVDPVYAGRALGGLIDLVRKDKFSPEDKILFWHTGGETALHAYGDELVAR